MSENSGSNSTPGEPHPNMKGSVHCDPAPAEQTKHLSRRAHSHSRQLSVSLSIRLPADHQNPAQSPHHTVPAHVDPIDHIMSAPPNIYAYCYAKFLVDISPDDAIKILWEGSERGDIKLNERVDQACMKLGGRSVNEIKGMIEARRWDELKDLRQSPTPSAMTPRDHRRTATGQTMPPTPSSTASGSPPLQRNSHDWILVYHMREEVRLTAKPSGSEHYLIGEDKLERFHGLIIHWTTHPQKVTLGGQLIDVAASVRLTWNRPEDSGTMYEQFWVVRPGLIQHADVLLGYKDQQFGIGRTKATNKTLAAVNSPLSLDPQDFCQVPPVPTPPQHQGFRQSSSTAIYSVHGSSPQGFGQASHSDFGMPNHQPPGPSARTDTMTSGPRSMYNSVSSRPPSMMERSPSRPQSASSTKTARPSKLNTVLVQLSFKGSGKMILALDLTKSGDEIVSYLEPLILKLSKGQHLDRSVHDLTITPLNGTEAEPQISPLSEEQFDYTWDAMAEFMRENRAGAESKKAEFQLDIG
ncbi:uncharacterized protein PAC_01038 [Phialocephala subalpina]|uniref:Uncharacterized protein n=1 Tax=Phialocephala subalpina TaxID=576137 RepID=A0A1L7WEE5_9HELO|nr:uncharacterized protein PAC_01038 [Phialocephala subalpina]